MSRLLEHINNTMLWAASTITFFGFCRYGEVTVQCESKFDPQTHLCFSDIAVDNALSPNTTYLHQVETL